MSHRLLNRYLGFLSLAGCLAAQTIYLPKQPGVWKPWKFTAIASARIEHAATPAELKAFEAKLTELSEFVRKVPGIGQPVGFSVETWGNLDSYRPSPGQPTGKQVPLAGAMTFGAFPIFEYQRNGKTIREDSGETLLMVFTVNNLQAVNHSRPPEWEQAETDAVMMPAPTGTMAGFPLISGQVVIQKNAKPLTVPFTIEQALQLVLPNRQSAFETARDNYAKQQAEFALWQTPAKRAERLKGYRDASDAMKDGGKFVQTMTAQEKDIEAALRANVAPNGSAAKSVQEAEKGLTEIRAALAAVPPAEAKGPACYNAKGATLSQRFRPAGAPSCVPLVRPNWSYFNAKLPRAVPQLIVVDGYGECLKSQESTVDKPWGCAANRKALEGIDWPAVINWLDH